MRITMKKILTSKNNPIKTKTKLETAEK